MQYETQQRTVCDGRQRVLVDERTVPDAQLACATSVGRCARGAHRAHPRAVQTCRPTATMRLRTVQSQSRPVRARVEKKKTMARAARAAHAAHESSNTNVPTSSRSAASTLRGRTAHGLLVGRFAACSYRAPQELLRSASRNQKHTLQKMSTVRSMMWSSVASGMPPATVPPAAPPRTSPRNHRPIATQLNRSPAAVHGGGAHSHDLRAESMPELEQQTQAAAATTTVATAGDSNSSVVVAPSAPAKVPLQAIVIDSQSQVH